MCTVILMHDELKNTYMVVWSRLHSYVPEPPESDVDAQVNVTVVPLIS